MKRWTTKIGKAKSEKRQYPILKINTYVKKRNSNEGEGNASLHTDNAHRGSKPLTKANNIKQIHHESIQDNLQQRRM